MWLSCDGSGARTAPLIMPPSRCTSPSPPQDPSAVQPNYTIHSSGYLFLHPSSLDSAEPVAHRFKARTEHGVRHPILDLIANATQEWCVRRHWLLRTALLIVAY